MPEYLHVAIIGAGNLAWHLAPALDNCGYAVKEVYSRDRKKANALVKRLYQAVPAGDLDFSDSNCRLFIVCIPDDAIEEVVKEIVLPDEHAILIHTSGSIPIQALEYAATQHVGVFYPLQTFSKSRKANFSEIPVLIEASDLSTEEILIRIAKSISKNVKRVSSTNRKAIHVAAVFACNFTNHMFTLSKAILDDEGLDFELLKPLITETINKSLEIGPGNAQTGPARREDFQTMDAHFDYLEEPAVQEIYRIISQNILDRYS
ncbi:MAG: DUF2520 domain-containing protein [Bacteroidetes bacterium]|nr:DUF2520 domain-containing protein [Bacteroidota bacterium]